MTVKTPQSGLMTAGLSLVLVVIALLSLLLIGTLRERQQVALDMAEVKDIKYGLLNADVWVQQVTTIIEKRIDDFELTPENRSQIKPILERALTTLLTEADQYLREQNAQAGVKGRFKQRVQDAFVDTEKVKQGIPVYADKILDEMNKPESREQIAALLKNMLGEVKQTTFAEVNTDPLAKLFEKYACKDREACEKVIADRLATNHTIAQWESMSVLVLTALLFIAVWAAPGQTSQVRLGLLVLCSTLLMLSGVLTPMMEVEARISELRFVLLSQPVVFVDQVLYFKSKSVLDVARTLMLNVKPDIKLVGVLVLTFGVIFPVLKLIASFVYLYDMKGLRRSRIVEFFALKSGKWSMADVFVVSMLMAYIGFDTLISNQLSRLSAKATDSVHILTTNGTSLQIGFFMFLAFCIASMMTSTMIESRLKEEEKAEEKKKPE